MKASDNNRTVIARSEKTTHFIMDRHGALRAPRDDNSHARNITSSRLNIRTHNASATAA